MTTAEKATDTHVDRLRAGLLGNEPGLEPSVRAALESGGDLAGREKIWDQVCGALDASASDDPRLTNQLRIRRRAVLSGKARGEIRRRFTLPHMAVATATSVALTLGFVSWMGQPPTGADGPISQAVQIASTDLANAIVSNVVDIDLDLTDNVDFYAWMGGQAGMSIESPEQGDVN